MKIKQWLKGLDIEIKEIDYSEDVEVYRLDQKHHLVFIKNDDNNFKIDNDLFYYINNQNLKYSFLLFNKESKVIYYLDYAIFSKWLKLSFQNCDKDEIYFGKSILQYKKSESEVHQKILSALGI